MYIGDNIGKKVNHILKFSLFSSLANFHALPTGLFFCAFIMIVDMCKIVL